MATQNNNGSALETTGVPAYSDEKLPAVSGTAQPVQMVGMPVAGMPMAVNPDYAYEVDAIKAAYQRYTNISLENEKVTCPQELSSRGLPTDTFDEIVRRVRTIKKRSNTNKAFLWPACIFCCGIIGWLLVDRRSVGNVKLSVQLAPVLEAFNMELGNRSIPVRFAWVQGTLRGYYR